MTSPSYGVYIVSNCVPLFDHRDCTSSYFMSIWSWLGFAVVIDVAFCRQRRLARKRQSLSAQPGHEQQRSQIQEQDDRNLITKQSRKQHEQHCSPTQSDDSELEVCSDH